MQTIFDTTITRYNHFEAAKIELNAKFQTVEAKAFNQLVESDQKTKRFQLSNFLVLNPNCVISIELHNRTTPKRSPVMQIKAYLFLIFRNLDHPSRPANRRSNAERAPPSRSLRSAVSVANGWCAKRESQCSPDPSCIRLSAGKRWEKMRFFSNKLKLLLITTGG